MISLVASQIQEPWTLVGACTQERKEFKFTSDGGSTFNSSIPLGVPPHVRLLSNLATRVKMCTSLQATDCVESTANTFPILNLRRANFPLSHIDGIAAAPCGPDCVTDYWRGSPQRLRNLQANNRYFTPTSFYHASGNIVGMHVVPGACTWNYTTLNDADGQQEDGVFLFLNVDGSLPPTPAPTNSPTDWTGDPQTVPTLNLLRTAVVSLESRATAAESRIRAAAAQMDLTALSTQVELINEIVLNQGSQLWGNISQTSGRIEALQIALKDAASGDAPNGNAQRTPSIQAVGQDMAVGAPGNIQLTSGNGACVVNNACEVTAFADRLRQALDALTNE